jgi:hypothetical protein
MHRGLSQRCARNREIPMRYIVISVLLLLAGCGGGSEGTNRRTATTLESTAANARSSRGEPPKPWLGQSIPFVAATAVDKVKWLQQAGIHADPVQLGTSYRLDETTPYVQSRGDLYDVYSSDTSHFFGGFASLRTRQTMDFGTVTPGMIVHVKTDATHSAL